LPYESIKLDILVAEGALEATIGIPLSRLRRSEDIDVELSPSHEAAIVRPGDVGAFVSSSCMIVRVANPHVIDPYYLAGWLTSPMGKVVLGGEEVLPRNAFLG
jgi:hypothetical protein